jgi:outer membrane protein assembly factor BamB
MINGGFLRTPALVVLALYTGVLAAGPARDATRDDWPQFRGPDGQGYSPARGLLLTWSDKENVAWKVAVPGLGWSSPVVGGKQIWLTTATDGGRSLRALCLDRITGKVRHNVEVFARKNAGPLHPKNSHASPTPILEGDRLYVHFGPYGTACLTTNGRVLWRTTLAYTPLYGPASSPVLFGDLLILHCDGTDVRYTVGLDKHTGKVRWKTSRAGRNSDSTPLVIRTGKGAQVISNVAERVVAYDAETGKELWWVGQGDNYAQVPRPVYGHGLVFTCGGYFHPVVYAIRPNGRGDVSTTHVVWSLRNGVPQTPSPVLAGDELYLVSDNGIASCVDARTGKLYWRERLGGNFSASPVVADGRIYFLDEEGTTVVVAAGRRFRKLAVNRVEGRTLASPAVAGRAIYLRTNTRLYRIEQPRPVAPPGGAG